MICISVAHRLLQPRKPALCPRCKTIMYLGPTGAPKNHKKGFCSDSVRLKLPDNKPSNYFPQWLQPEGVFSATSNGTTFNPVPFLAAIHEMYLRVVVGGASTAMEYEAFAEMLNSCTSVRVDGAILFKLYPEFAITSCPAELVVKENESGDSYLSMDCL